MSELKSLAGLVLRRRYAVICFEAICFESAYLD